MATATQMERSAGRGPGPTEAAPRQAFTPVDPAVMAGSVDPAVMAGSVDPAVIAGSDQRDQYRCECGHVLHVFGGGRHRRYFELTDFRLDDPVMERACPQCGRGLPGKNRP